MEKLEATFRIVTPMFIAGADQHRAELRAPSIKGALRFWWRALNWDRVKKNSPEQESAIDLFRQQESKLFGDAGNRGQSKVLLKLPKTMNGSLSVDILLNSDSLRKYLGYGLFTMWTHAERYAIQENQEFRLEMLLRTNSEQYRQLQDSIKALGLLGGLGSRSRRGFGSVAIQSLGGNDFNFTSLSEYQQTVSDLLDINNLSSDEPPLTAFSTNSKVIFGPLQNSSEEAHRFLGGLYKDFRTARQHEPRKKFFGLPLQGAEYDDATRRASPLFFHIHPIGTKYVPVVIYIPADFHPQYTTHDYSLVEEFVHTFEEDAK